MARGTHSHGGAGETGTPSTRPHGSEDNDEGAPSRPRAHGGPAGNVAEATASARARAQAGRASSGGTPAASPGGTPPARPRKPYKPNEPADPAHLAQNRPKLRTPTRRSVYKDAQRAPNGEDFVCPNSGEIIPCKRDANGNALRFNDRGQPDPNGYTHPADNPRSDAGQPAVYHFGHREDSEYRRLIAVVEDHPGTVSNRQFRDEYNQPGHYQVEHPPTNVGHGSESTTPGYGHYSHLAPPPTTTDTGQTTAPAPTSAPGSMDTSRPRLRR
jgi:hypothetical protein